MGYKIKLDVFEGPLDLLIYLIKKNDVEIQDIPITQITEQYMEYIELMKMLDLEVVGDFLVMAATLIQIKSRMLLPPDPSEDEEDDPRDELVQRLTEYQQFKEIAEDLESKELMRKDLYARSSDEDKQKQLRDEAKENYFEASLFDLISALTEALNKTPDEVIHEIVQEEFTVEQKIHDILHLLIAEEHIVLHDLFGKAKTKNEVIVTFLAVLELIRLKEIKIIQKKIFGEIEVMRNTDNMIPTDGTEESNGRE